MTGTGYRDRFSGRLIGLLQWSRFEKLWSRLAAEAEGWYVRDFGRDELPDAPLSAADFRDFLRRTEDFLRRRHREDYCGFLYVDDAENPTFIKVFDPRKMGSACGCGGSVSPRWTISRMPPEPLEEDAGRPAGGDTPAPSLLRRLFG